MAFGTRVSTEQEVCTAHSCLSPSFIHGGQMRLQGNCEQVLYQRQVIRSWVQAEGSGLSVPLHLVKILQIHHLWQLGRWQILLFQFVLYFIIPLTFLFDCSNKLIKFYKACSSVE